MTDAHEYAIAGSYDEFLEWRREAVPARRRVIFLDRPERAVGQPSRW